MADKQGLGGRTQIVLVDTAATTVEAAIAEISLTHTIAGVAGDYLAVQGTGAITAADVSVVVDFA
jgi:hypothetical protein